MGQKLASTLNHAIEARENDENSSADIIESMATVSGIDVDTVRQILRGDIVCPPLERLQGFAKVLDTPVEALRNAAESDGCDYTEREDPAKGPTIREVIPKEQYLRLQRIKDDLERALDPE
jgi:hypothetical protein